MARAVICDSCDSTVIADDEVLGEWFTGSSSFRGATRRRVKCEEEESSVKRV